MNSRTPLDHVQVDLQNAPLAQDEFGHWYQCELRALAEQRAARSIEQGSKRFGFRSSRYSLSSSLRANGENPQLVQAMLLWTSLNMLAH